MRNQTDRPRRALLKGIVAATTTLGSTNGTAAIAMQGAGTGETSRLRTIALIGDRVHNSDAIRVSLERLFHELELSIDYATNYHDLSAELNVFHLGHSPRVHASNDSVSGSLTTAQGTAHRECIGSEMYCGGTAETTVGRHNKGCEVDLTRAGATSQNAYPRRNG
jgi:hypothetical protein